MATAPLYNAAGDQVGEASLGDAVFGQPVREDLVHLAVVRDLSNRRQGTHSALNRSNVRGGGRKPFRQKGTGRARQGSTRAPHQRHGGVAHGPEPHGHEKAMPQKMRRAAFRSALSAKAGDGAIKVLEGLSVSDISTKQFAAFLQKLEPGKRTVVVLTERNENAILSARNIPNLKLIVLPGLSTYEVVKTDTLIFTQAAVSKIEELYAG